MTSGQFYVMFDIKTNSHIYNYKNFIKTNNKNPSIIHTMIITVAK